MTRRSRLNRLEARLDINTPLPCCALDTPESFHERFTEARRLQELDPARSWADIRCSLLPTTCSRTGGELCDDGKARCITVADRVRRVEANMAGVDEDML
jgi:hypothetical protein